MFLSLAFIFASINSSLGQTYKTNDPKGWVAPSCGDEDEYHPAVGMPYDYTVSISSDGGYTGNGTYTWKVVTGTAPLNLLTASDVGSSIYSVNSGSGTEKINISWLPASTGNIYYLVMDYTEKNVTNAAGEVCDINNVKVFPIAPQTIFWLDINASTTSNAGDIAATDLAAFNLCAPDVAEATIVTAGDINDAVVNYDFGENKIYTVIHSAGYTGTYNASLKITGLLENQGVEVSGWTVGTVDTYGNGIYTKTLNSTIAGSNEVVEIIVSQNQHESLASQVIKIEVDGYFELNGVRVDDMSDVNGNCSVEDEFADGVNITITPRPTVNPVAPTNLFPTDNIVP